MVSIIDNSVVICDEIIDTKKTVQTKSLATKSTSTNFYVLLPFLLITVALLIAVSICCCFIKYRARNKSIYYRITSQITN